MNNHVDIKKYWQQKLVLVKPEQAILSKIPQDTLYFLQNVGLPNDLELQRRMKIFWNYNPSVLSDSRFVDRDFLDFGEFRYKSEIHKLVIDCTNETVYKIIPHYPFLPPSETGDDIFVNSNIQEFLMYLCCYLQYRPMLDTPIKEKIDYYGDVDRKESLKRRKQAQEEIMLLLEKIRLKFSSISIKPIAELNRFWADLLFELEDM